MKLSTKVRYGVRALFDLAYHCQGVSGQVKDIARRQHISIRYLEQIFHRLKKAGLVKSERGPKGGYLLSRPASQITVGDVYRATEGPLVLVSCTGKDESCKHAIDCAAVGIWKHLNDDLGRLLDSVSVEEFCTTAEQKGIAREADNKYMYFI